MTYFFLQALADQRRDEDIVEGIQKLVEAYYDEYSDATEIEPSVLTKLRAIEDLCIDLHIDFDLEATVRTAEANVHRDTGRRVQTFEPDEDDGED